MYEDSHDITLPKNSVGEYKDPDIGGPVGYLTHDFQIVADALNLHDGAGRAIDKHGEEISRGGLFMLNDQKNKTFPEIAAIVRANPQHYFKETPACTSTSE